MFPRPSHTVATHRPGFYDEMRRLPGCDALDARGMLKFFMGHTHCNVRAAQGAREAGWLASSCASNTDPPRVGLACGRPIQKCVLLVWPAPSAWWPLPVGVGQRELTPGSASRVLCDGQVPHPHGNIDTGFMVAGQGMEGCGNYGIPIIDTTEGRVRVWHFEIQPKVRAPTRPAIDRLVKSDVRKALSR